MLRLENINKSFGKLKVLKNINLEINKGDRIVIIGPSGSGKSTLLRAINFLGKPDSGKIYFNDEIINDKNISLYRQKIGMVFQNFNLFNNLNVMDNIILAPVKLGIYNEKEARDKAMDYLDRINLTDKAMVYPSSLSGGQKQRIAIATALSYSSRSTRVLRSKSTCSSESTVFSLTASFAGLSIFLITER